MGTWTRSSDGGHARHGSVRPSASRAMGHSPRSGAATAAWAAMPTWSWCSCSVSSRTRKNCWTNNSSTTLSLDIVRPSTSSWRARPRQPVGATAPPAPGPSDGEPRVAPAPQQDRRPPHRRWWPPHGDGFHRPQLAPDDRRHSEWSQHPASRSLAGVGEVMLRLGQGLVGTAVAHVLGSGNRLPGGVRRSRSGQRVRPEPHPSMPAITSQVSTRRATTAPIPSRRTRRLRLTEDWPPGGLSSQPPTITSTPRAHCGARLAEPGSTRRRPAPGGGPVAGGGRSGRQTARGDHGAPGAN